MRGSGRLVFLFSFFRVVFPFPHILLFFWFIHLNLLFPPHSTHSSLHKPAMTVPADASVNTTSSTNKLRPLTALPVPMLPSAEQLAKARPQTSTSAPTPPGATRLTSIKNASLSSWLSHGTQNTTGSHSPGSNGHPIDVIRPEGIDHLKIGPDPQEHTSTESMDVDGHHDTDAHPRDASSSHTPPPPPPPNGAPMKGKRGRKPKPKPDPNDPNSPPPKPKERKPRTPKDPLEPKVPKEKAPRKKKADVARSGDIGGDGTTGRSILNYFKSNSGPGKAPSAKVKLMSFCFVISAWAIHI